MERRAGEAESAILQGTAAQRAMQWRERVRNGRWLPLRCCCSVRIVCDLCHRHCMRCCYTRTNNGQASSAEAGEICVPPIKG